VDVLNLADALNLLRAELATAQDAGEGHQFRFEIDQAEIEFLVTLNAEGSVEGRVGFGVVAGTGKGSISETATHRLKLTLNVKDAATDGRLGLELSG